MGKEDLKLYIGKKLPTSIGVEESRVPYFVSPLCNALSNSVLLVVLQGPYTNNDLDELKKKLEIRVAEIDGLIDFVYTFNDNFRFDNAFNPHFVDKSSIDEWEYFVKGKGLGIHLLFIDGETKLLYQRLVYLDTDTSNKVIKLFKKKDLSMLSKDDYFKRIYRLYNSYTLNDISELAEIRQTFKHEH